MIPLEIISYNSYKGTIHTSLTVALGGGTLVTTPIKEQYTRGRNAFLYLIY